METKGTSSSGRTKGSTDVSHDIKESEESTLVEMEKLPVFSDECCIYRVPKQLYEINKKAYTPQLVSIGPFHHGKEELKAMEAHKTLYLQVFMEWTKVSLEDLFRFIEERETRLRNCCAETIELSSKAFVKMMLLDAVIILSLLLMYTGKLPPKNDRIWNKPWKLDSVRVDMCMLENQLPFFILEELLQLFGILSYLEDWPMTKLVYMFLKDVWESWLTEDILEKVRSSNYKAEHFVDFLRICQMPTKELQEEKQPNEYTKLTTLSAIELHQAGVKFKCMSISTSDCWKLFDMKFNINNGVLEILPLKITEYTELLFRNLQAFEQCHCKPAYNYFNDYITIFGMIVCSTADAELLVQKKIIVNWLVENDAVRRFFVNLCVENTFCRELFYFSNLIKDLNEYSRKRRNRWKASLKQKYFYNPWAIISVIAAAFLIILTIIQAVCSIIQVV